MQLTVDSFRALALSSPWRWTRLHLRHRSGFHDTGLDVEAWLTRPDGIRVVDAQGRPLEPTVVGQRADGVPTGPWRPPAATFRPDGLVAARPGENTWDMTQISDGLYWHNYHWLAMLDPVELSHHVELTDLRETDLGGRRTWWATAVPQLGYDPRCGGNCCELLWSEAGLRADFPTDEEAPAGWGGGPYPTSYEVALDVATGVVARIRSSDGVAAPWVDNDILDSA